MRFVVSTIAILFVSAAWAKEEPRLPKELRDFLGPPPKKFEERFLKPAKKLRLALDAKRQGKLDKAIAELRALAESSELMDHAGYELALALREKKEFRKSNAELNKLMLELPPSAYSSTVERMVLENDCDMAMKDAGQAKGPARKRKASRSLMRCLAKTPWRSWTNLEPQAEALFEIYRSSKDPLLGPFVAELFQALPSSSPLRAKITSLLPEKELKEYTNVPRFRTKSSSPAGVKPIQPDAEIFDQGMLQVLEENWKDANETFRKLINEYPETEHMERALYWVARAEESLGNSEEAKRRYDQIFTNSPLSYYGLQSALRTKRSLSSFVVPSEMKPKPLEGTLLARQALSLWKLRALYEAGLVDHAREEAEFLFQTKPGGYGIGQDSADGALLMAFLFHTAGYHLGAFAHGYAAASLDSSQLNAFNLGLIFPFAFQQEFSTVAEATGIHELVLLSLTKQESAFLPTAVSRADALGLMQLLLSTARDMDPTLERNDLFVPEKNVSTGAKYLQKMLDRYQGNLALALAAYNAGPTRASQWQKRMLEFESMRKLFDIDVFIDSIPFSETRKYVSSILRNFAWYKLLANDGTISSIQELTFQWQKPQKAQPKP